MTETTTIFVSIPDLRPTPQGSKRAFKNRHTGKIVLTEQTGSNLKAYRNAIVEAVREANTGDITFTGPVTVDVGFHFAPPKRISITTPEPVYDGNPGDVDKLSRAVLDALTTSGIIHDDKQVALLLAHKHWNPILGNETRIAIKGQAPCD